MKKKFLLLFLKDYILGSLAIFTVIFSFQLFAYTTINIGWHLEKYTNPAAFERIQIELNSTFDTVRTGALLDLFGSGFLCVLVPLWFTAYLISEWIKSIKERINKGS